MADEEQLERLLRDVEEWNWWRDENPGIEIDLSSADFRSADLRSADLKDANLNSADLRSVNLSGADLRGAYLAFAYLSAANLFGTKLSVANLWNADLSATQAIYTNFEGAILTGACIRDWNINNKTNLDDVVCKYIYLGLEFQNDKIVYTDRRPSDPSKTFEPEDFARLVQKSLDTVDLIFREGIDWQTFSNSFQALKTEQIKVETDDRTFSVREIKSLDDGSFVVRINIPKGADKVETERGFWEMYNPILEAKNEQLALMGEQLQCEREASKELRRIVQIMAEKDSISFSGNTIYGSGYTEGNTTVNVNQSQDLASAAKEIQDLLEQLSETYPTTTLSEKSVVASKAIARIKSDRNWLGKVVGIIKAMGKEALFEAIDHPAANVFRAGFEELLSD